MKWKIDKTKYEYYGRYYGIPCYVNTGGDSIEVVGRNVLTDFLINHILIFGEIFAIRASSWINFVFDTELQTGWSVFIGEKIEEKNQ